MAPPEKGKALNERGIAAMARADYVNAERLFRESVQIWQSLGPVFELHLATGQINVGDALCGEGRWIEGAALFEQSLQTNRRLLGTGNLRTLANMTRLANVYLVIGKPELSEPLYREALAVQREHPVDDIQLVRTLEGIAALHMREGQLDVAMPEAEEALRIASTSIGENTAEAALAYASVGEIYRISGRSDRALPLLRKGRSMLEQIVGPNHPRVAAILSQEGLALMREGKLAMAEQALVRSVNILSAIPGATVELAVSEHNLGLLRVRQKKYNDADGLLTRALALEEKYSLPNGNETLATRQVLDEVRKNLR